MANINFHPKTSITHYIGELFHYFQNEKPSEEYILTHKNDAYQIIRKRRFLWNVRESLIRARNGKLSIKANIPQRELEMMVTEINSSKH